MKVMPNQNRLVFVSMMKRGFLYYYIQILLLFIILVGCINQITEAVSARDASTCRFINENNNEQLFGVDILVCRLPSDANDEDTDFTKINCNVRPEDGFSSGCEQVVIPNGGQDCQRLNIMGCTVYCVKDACDNSTFTDSDVSVSLVSSSRIKEFIDSTVYCDYCYDSAFINSDVYTFATLFGVIRNSRVYSESLTGAQVFDSVVTCDLCRSVVFERCQVRCLNLNEFYSRECTNAEMINSQVSCDLPQNLNAQFPDVACGRLDECSCCSGDGCNFANETLCTTDFCDKTITESQTCTNQQNPFCNPEPFCNSGTLGAFWGDPHIITLDGLPFDCMVPGESVLLKSTDGSRQINGLFTKVGEYFTVTTGVAVESPLFNFVNTMQLQMVVTNNLMAESAEIVGECAIQFFEGVVLRSKEFLFEERGYVNVVTASDPNRVELEFPALGIELYVEVHKFVIQETGEEVCFFSTDAFLSCEHDHGYLVGLLGNGNGDSTDDWNDPETGETVSQPSDPNEYFFGDAYGYCAKWCVKESRDSLFPALFYSDFSVWTSIQNCDDPYFNPLDPGRRNLIDADPAVQAICGNEIACLVDGITFGVEAAQFYISNKERILKRQQELSPGDTQPTPSPVIINEPTTAPIEPTASPNEPTTAPIQATASPVVGGSDDDEECTAFFLICFFLWLFRLFFG